VTDAVADYAGGTLGGYPLLALGEQQRFDGTAGVALDGFNGWSGMPIQMDIYGLCNDHFDRLLSPKLHKKAGVARYHATPVR
jgi:hypothetical protein